MNINLILRVLNLKLCVIISLRKLHFLQQKQVKLIHFIKTIYPFINKNISHKNRFISSFYLTKTLFCNFLSEPVNKLKEFYLTKLKPATHFKNPGVLIRALIISVILLSFSQLAGAQQPGDYRTKISGNWINPAIWERYNGTVWVSVTNSPVDVQEGVSLTISVGTTVNSGSLTVQPLGILHVDGNLIIDGELTMNFSGSKYSFIYTEVGSVVVINGNATLTNKTVLSIDSYFIVRGNFNESSGKSEVVVEDNAEVYIFGTENSSGISTCDTFPSECNSGNSTAFVNNLASFPPVVLEEILVGVDCSTDPPTWVTEPQNNGNITIGSAITLTANASSINYSPVSYRWTGPNNYYYVTTNNTVNINNANSAMSGTYYCTAVNNIGCSITSSTEVIVGSSCNNAVLTLNTGNASQTVCEYEPISNIIYTIGGDATGAQVTGLPNGITGSYNNGKFTISGAPTQSAAFSFTITTTGTPAACNEATVTGNITVNLLPATGEITSD